MSNRSLYINRYKCCFYNRDLSKKFVIIEAFNLDEVRKELNSRYGIQIYRALRECEVSEGIKYIRKIR